MNIDDKPEKGVLNTNGSDREQESLLSFDSDSDITSDSTFENFFNISLDLLCIADTDGNFIRVNKSWEDILGYSTEHLEKRKFFEFVHPDDMPATLNAIAQLENQSQVLNFVNRYKCKDGSWKYIEWRSNPKGNLIYAAARDITQRVEAEAALIASDERFSLVVDATEMGVWDWNVETNVVYYSPQWKKQVGYDDHELKNEFKTWQGLLHPDDYDRIHKELQDYLTNPTEHFIAEFRLKHKKGHYIWIHNKASSKKDASGKVTRFFGAHTDITEQKLATMLLEEKSNQIETQNEEYKQLNEELHCAKVNIEKSEKKFRTLIESAFDGIYLLEGRTFNYVNPRFIEITGYSFDEITSADFDFTRLLTQNSKRIVEERYNARLKGEIVPARYEFQIITKQGKTKDVEVSTVPVGMQNSLLIMGIMSDITHRRKMEKDIDYQSMFQKVLLTLGTRFINVSSHNINKEINEALAEMGSFSQVDRAYIFSYDFEKDTMSNSHEWCSDGTSPAIQNLQNLPNNLVPQWVSTHRNGEIIHIPSVAALPLGDSVREILESQGVQSVITIPMLYNQNCLGFVGFDSVKAEKEWSETDIKLLQLFADLLVNVQVKDRYQKSLKQAKEIAETSELQVRNVIDHSPIGVLVIDKEGNILDLNDASIRILGSPSRELTKKINILKTKPLQDIGFVDDFKQCIYTKQLVSNEKQYTSLWGKSVYVKYFLVPIIIDNKVSSILANLEDITEVKETERKLVMLKEKAEESDKLKSAFLSNMSHEIRTPMNAICGFSNLLLSKSISDEQREEFVEIININSQQLLSIINDIIDVSKIESGQVSVSNIKFSVNELLDEIKTIFAPSAKMKGISVSTNYSLGNIESTIMSDELKIKQIINNLTYNALKFTEKGFIELGYQLKHGFLEFYVKDTGIGIAPENFNRIFERFQQVDNATSESRRGTGLGLPISKAFVELLGGRIWLDSKLGEGSTFYFSIPYNTPSAQATQQEKIKDVSYSWSDKTVLIAEDDHPNYMYLRELIRETRANILRAKNGHEAVNMCKEARIDLILMDIKMPILNGFEATKAIRELGMNTPIIAQTAYAFSEDKEMAIESGCNDYISKPIKKDELLKMMARWL